MKGGVTQVIWVGSGDATKNGDADREKRERPGCLQQTKFPENSVGKQMEHDSQCLPFTWAKRSVHGLGSGLSSFVPESGVCRLYKSVPFNEKRPQIP